jgi:Family of unknown function (DUF6064)
MRLPFTDQQFFDVFGSYNAASWPIVVGLWLATIACAAGFVRGSVQSVALSTLAAAHWLVSGVVYHALFFTTINPAAWWFAGLFMLEAAAFVWFGIVRRSLVFHRERTTLHGIALAFVAYSLAYPFLVMLSGHFPPRAPLFAVPCPTTVFTTGLLLTARPARAALVIVPTIWAVIGGTAAFAFGMTPDLVLFAAAICLIGYGLSPWIATSEPRTRFGRPA